MGIILIPPHKDAKASELLRAKHLKLFLAYGEHSKNWRLCEDGGEGDVMDHPHFCTSQRHHEEPPDTKAYSYGRHSHTGSG